MGNGKREGVPSDRENIRPTIYIYKSDMRDVYDYID